MNSRKPLITLIVLIFVTTLLYKVLVVNNPIVGLKNYEKTSMKIESEVFINNDKIPVAYTCNGEGLKIPLQISEMPTETQSLAIIVDDPDAPSGDFVHWVIWNINPQITTLGVSNLPQGVEGYTSLNKPGFVPPCPPSGIHHYNFKLYALDTILSIPESSNKADLLQAMEGHILENAQLTGLYGKES